LFFLPSNCYEKLGKLTKSFYWKHNWNIISKHSGYPSSTDKFFAVFFRGLKEERGNRSSSGHKRRFKNKQTNTKP
jgi:hypothetical protein